MLRTSASPERPTRWMPQNTPKCAGPSSQSLPPSHRLTPAQIIGAVKPHLSEALFPGGETAGWWVKCVQLDLEAKGVLKRAPKSPVRLWRVS